MVLFAQNKLVINYFLWRRFFALFGSCQFTCSINLCSLRSLTCLTLALDLEMNSCLWINIASCKVAFCQALSANLLVESKAFLWRGTLRLVKIGQYLKCFLVEIVTKNNNYHVLGRLTGPLIVCVPWVAFEPSLMTSYKKWILFLVWALLIVARFISAK